MASAGGRQSHVSGLSGKIQGLKFMQRASASSNTPSPSASPASRALPASALSRSVVPTASKGKGQLDAVNDASAASPPTSRESTTALEPDDENEEHWVLPSKTSATQTATDPASRIGDENGAEEMGWNAFLSQASASLEDEKDKGVGSSRRRVFGSWGDKKSREQRKPEDDEPDYDMSGDDERKSLSEEAQGLADSGFIKPGTMDKRRQERKRSSDNVLLSGARGSHAKAREEASKRKKLDMSSEEKAKIRRKHGFYVPDPSAEATSSSDDEGDDSISIFEGNDKRSDKAPSSISANSSGSQAGNRKAKKGRSKKR